MHSALKIAFPVAKSDGANDNHNKGNDSSSMSSSSWKHCPGVELAPNVWSFVVVLQKNGVGAPTLMTGADRLFDVTCDFSNLLLNPTSSAERERLDESRGVDGGLTNTSPIAKDHHHLGKNGWYQIY